VILLIKGRFSLYYLFVPKKKDVITQALLFAINIFIQLLLLTSNGPHYKLFSLFLALFLFLSSSTLMYGHLSLGSP